MGRPEWAGRRRPAVEAPAGAGDPGHLERLARRCGRQDGGEPAGGHRLARARGADHQQAVPAGGGDLERVAQVALAAQVGEVRPPGRSAEGRRAAAGPAARASTLPRPARGSGQAARPASPRSRRPAPPRGRSRAGTTIDAAPRSRAASAIAQHPGYRADGSVESELADHRRALARARPLELARGGQQRGRDRQVHPRPRLAQAGRGKVGDDPAAAGTRTRNWQAPPAPARGPRAPRRRAGRRPRRREAHGGRRPRRAPAGPRFRRG